MFSPRKIFRRLTRQPAPRKEPDPFQLLFRQSIPLFEAFLAKCDIPNLPADSDPPLGVLISPWGWNVVPWYGLATGIGLLQRGRRVIFVWDDLPVVEPKFVHEQNEAIGRMLARLPDHVRVVRLSEQPVAPAREGDAAALDRLAAMNQLWYLKAGPPTDDDRSRTAKLRAGFEPTLGAIRSALAEAQPECLVTPGGIVFSSGVLVMACREAGVRVVTYDANVGVIQWANHGIASQQSDLGAAYDFLTRERPETRAWMVEKARAAYAKRVTGSDNDAYQHALPSREAEKVAGDLVMPLNVEWDSAALGTHHLFENNTEWIDATVRHVLEQSSKSIVVRQHPAERRPGERSRSDTAGYLREQFGREPRVRFVAAEDNVNTYDLIRLSSLVLPFVSTIGIEAAAMGKPVLQAGSCYYSRIGIVHWPETRERYFELLDRGLRGELGLLPDQVERAWLCYYLTPIANRVWTKFTPQPNDFPRWVGTEPAELFAEPEVSDILDSIVDGTSLGLIRHRRLLAEHGSI